MFLGSLVDTVMDILGDEYPELRERQELIKQIIDTEEKQFSATLAQGMELLNDMMSQSDNKVLSGDNVFKLYDTYGFPMELTEEIAGENGMTIDTDVLKQP